MSVELNVDLLEPHPKQQLFVDSTAKRIIIKAGRRGGKTTGIAIRAAIRFLKGRRVLYAAPTADQLNAFWKEIVLSFAEPIDNGVLRKNETEHVIEWPGKSARIRAKTAWNAETLRGDFADDLILDEFQLMNEDAWETVGAPMLIDNNGDAVFIFTPPSLHAVGTSKAKDLRHAAKMFKRAQTDKTGRWQAIHFTSHDNPHVSEEGLAEITVDMTALAYRQEILAEDIDEVPGALWTRKLIEETRVDKAPELVRIIIGVDPSGSSTNEAGIVAVGVGSDDHFYILRDCSLLAPTSKAWASAAVDLYDELRADLIVGERNYGGDMVRETIRAIDDGVSYKDVNATRGKLVRASPAAARSEQKILHLVGKFERLEDEMCSYVPGNPSPNRMDAMVWAVTELIGGGYGVVSYYRDGAAETQLAAVTGAVKEKPSACPECGNEVIQVVAGQNRCSQCGVQWNKNAAKTPFVATRKDYLAGVFSR